MFRLEKLWGRKEQDTDLRWQGRLNTADRKSCNVLPRSAIHTSEAAYELLATNTDCIRSQHHFLFLVVSRPITERETPVPPPRSAPSTLMVPRLIKYSEQLRVNHCILTKNIFILANLYIWPLRSQRKAHAKGGRAAQNPMEPR